jgi:hypothetical protein
MWWAVVQLTRKKFVPVWEGIKQGQGDRVVCGVGNVYLIANY